MRFEGFMDYLSFLTLRQKKCPNYPDLDKQDYLILNSVSNHKEYGLCVRDSSHIYSGYKDLNNYLCGKQFTQSADLKRQTKQTQATQQADRQEQTLIKKKSRRFRM